MARHVQSPEAQSACLVLLQHIDSNGFTWRSSQATMPHKAELRCPCLSGKDHQKAFH